MTPKTKLFAKTFSALALMLLASPTLAAGFTSPSGNIVCYQQSDANSGRPLPEWPMVCLIFEADWAPPADDFGGDGATCDLDRTRTIVLPFDGPAREEWACHGDVFWPFDGAISYGAEWVYFDYTCQMATSGVSCQNASGNGFSVNRAGRTLF